MAVHESMRLASAQACEEALFDLEELVRAFDALANTEADGVPPWLWTLQRHLERLSPAVQQVVEIVYRSTIPLQIEGPKSEVA